MGTLPAEKRLPTARKSKDSLFDDVPFYYTFDYLSHIFGFEFNSSVFLPSWRSCSVHYLARSMFNRESFWVFSCKIIFNVTLYVI
jgi:hypothetical protein